MEYRASILLFCANRTVRPTETLEQLLEFIRESKDRLELVVAIDGQLGMLARQFEEKLRGVPDVKLVHLNTSRGQVGTICAGLALASGRSIITFPAFPQVSVRSIPRVLDALEAGADYVVGFRENRSDSPMNRVTGFFFNRLVRWLTGLGFRDVSCGMHGLRNDVADSVPNYGDNQLYLPILLAREGFSVREVAVLEHEVGPRIRLFTPATVVRRSLDLLTLSYLVRFTHKPLRPFGLLGVVLFVVGVLLLLVLAWQRLVLHQPLAERPMLLLALLLVTAGVQVVILGFLGELMIYLHFREQSNYRVAQRFGQRSADRRRDSEAEPSRDAVAGGTLEPERPDEGRAS